MEVAIAGILAVAVIVAVSVFARRLGVAAPIILVLAGIGISFIPRIPDIEVPSELILDIVLPPVLYAAAISLPFADFRRNLAPISSLAVLLVLLSAAGVGFLLWGLLPGLGLAAAVALGAVVSPPDAVAATSVGRRLGLPPRLLTVLEGEGLVNDATALVLLRSALAVAAGTLTTPWHAIGDFAYAVAFAIGIGLAVGALTVFIRSKLGDPVLDTIVSLAVPFIAFVPAQTIGASGVLAVVVAGLYTGYAGPGALSAQARMSDKINWRTIQFILENGVFLLIGLEIAALVDDVESSGIGVASTFALGLLVTVVLIGIRFLWMPPLIYVLQRRQRRAEARLEHDGRRLEAARRRFGTESRFEPRLRRVEARHRRTRWDLAHLRREQFDWRSGLVIGWSGMRGVVTLAAAQTLPEDTPYRSELILIAYTVAVASLLLQGGTLPLLIRLVRFPQPDRSDERDQVERLVERLRTAGAEVLEDPAASIGVDDAIDPEVVERVRRSTQVTIEFSNQKSPEELDPDELHPLEAYRRLRLAVVDAQRAALLEARSSGRFSSSVISHAQELLDLDDLRLRRPEENGGH